MPFGELLSKRGRAHIDSEEGGKLFGFDELLGDDDFVFLSVGAPAKGVFSEGDTETRFVFDSEELVRRGALVRLGDIMMTDAYADFDFEIQKEQGLALEEFHKLAESERLTVHQGRRLETLRDMLGGEFSVDEMNTNEMSAEQLQMFIRENASIRLAWDALKMRHDQITLHGDAALKALRACTEEQGCEILVPKRLSLHLVAGSEVEVWS